MGKNYNGLMRAMTALAATEALLAGCGSSGLGESVGPPPKVESCEAFAPDMSGMTFGTDPANALRALVKSFDNCYQAIDPADRHMTNGISPHTSEWSININTLNGSFKMAVDFPTTTDNPDFANLVDAIDMTETPNSQMGVVPAHNYYDLSIWGFQGFEIPADLGLAIGPSGSSKTPPVAVWVPYVKNMPDASIIDDYKILTPHNNPGTSAAAALCMKWHMLAQQDTALSGTAPDTDMPLLQPPRVDDCMPKEALGELAGVVAP